MTEKENIPFIGYLYRLAEREERSALAELRRGLGQPPGTAANMHRYVVPWLPKERHKEEAYYLVASLFAYHPKIAASGNFGDHYRHLNQVAEGRDAADRRFTVLLSAHPEDLPVYLRQAVALLKSKDVPVNWDRLLRDLFSWNHPDGFVQRNWAKAYWGTRQEQTDPSISQEIELHLQGENHVY